MKPLCLAAIAFKTNAIGQDIDREGCTCLSPGQDLPTTMPAGGSEAAAFVPLWLAPWTEAFAKVGSILWTPFWARLQQMLHCGAGFGAAWRTPF